VNLKSSPSPEGSDLIADLQELRRSDQGEFGGKAAMLGEIIATGLLAPPGLAVSVSYYAKALREADGDPGRLDAEELAKCLLQLWPAGPSDRWLIVRSSATVEDSVHLSYAGQFLSKRCRCRHRDLADAIVTVWSSALAPHVKQYQAAFAHRNPERSEVADTPEMGLVIQSYLHFDVAGLFFTQHPTVAINDWALCEYLDVDPDLIVGGEVTPHRCRVSNDGKRLLWERRAPDAPVLQSDELRALCEGGSRLREAMGIDVDIEWGQQGKSTWFLQCRPMTTFPAKDIEHRKII
jgi:phosphoenolpyruvate synthase/pyruvate phosphate dikinase